MFTDDGHFKPKALAALRESYVELKTLPKEPDMTQALHRSVPAEVMTQASVASNER